MTRNARYKECQVQGMQGTRYDLKQRNIMKEKIHYETKIKRVRDNETFMP